MQRAAVSTVLRNIRIHGLFVTTLDRQASNADGVLCVVWSADGLPHGWLGGLAITGAARRASSGA